MTRPSSGASYLIAALLIGGAFFVGKFAREMYLAADETSRWLSAEGTVVSATMVRERLRRSEWGDDRSRYNRFKYSTTIAYKYNVNGKEYVSNSISLSRAIELKGSTSRDATGAAREGALLALYPVGKRVNVYYDPADPATSLLEPGEFGFAWLIYAVAGVLVLLALAFFSSARHPA